MSEDTTSPSYWLNLTFLLCALQVLLPMFLAGFLIWRFEGFNASSGQSQRSAVGFLSKDETWRPCLVGIRPAWLLAFRVFAFAVLFTLITTNIVQHGGGVFFFYTQLTFALVTIYFGLGSLLSIYGCFLYHEQASEDRAYYVNLDSEQCIYVPPSTEGNPNVHAIHEASACEWKSSDSQSTGFGCYIHQIIYQTAGGAVILTDSIFWLILYPLMASKNYELDFQHISLHSLNAVFLLGDSILNDMRFPLFRVAYFILWTCMYVISQWIIHACIPLRWPYPFLDLKIPYAPLWYLGVAVWHIPCYGFFALVVRLKRLFLSRQSPELFQS